MLKNKRSNMATSIYIDDTGTAQTRSTFVYDTAKSKSWCAVMLNHDQYQEAVRFMTLELEELKSVFDLNEFHFTDIFSGKKAYRDQSVPFDVRMDIFKEFALFSKRNQFPVFFQSFGKDSYSQSKLKRTILTKIDGFDLNSYEDMGLFILLMQVKRYLSSHPEYSAPYKIIIDEGRRPNGAVQPCAIFDNLLEQNQILYKSSVSENLLQIADFVAFTLNRCNWLNMKEPIKINEYDKCFLSMASYANFNAPYMVKCLLPIDSNRSGIYKELLDDASRKNDQLPVTSVEEFILEMIKSISTNQN